MIRKTILAACILAAYTQFAIAQTPYTSTPDERNASVHILNGTISKYILQNDPQFTWYGKSQDVYTPAVNVVNALEAAKSDYQLVIFGGTWCEDTQFILPKFFKLQETSGFPDNHISFFAVNRAKQTLGNLASAFRITNVPTIIVMKEGKEVGRVVEYGKSGKWDEELAALLK